MRVEYEPGPGLKRTNPSLVASLGSLKVPVLKAGFLACAYSTIDSLNKFSVPRVDARYP